MQLVSSFSVLLEQLSFIMTEPTFHNFITLLTGWVFARRRTVTGMTQSAGAVDTRHHSVYHVCFAYALLTHLTITRHGAQVRKNRTLVHASMETLQNELRRLVWDDLADYLKGLPNGNSVAKELTRFLAA